MESGDHQSEEAFLEPNPESGIPENNVTSNKQLKKESKTMVIRNSNLATNKNVNNNGSHQNSKSVSRRTNCFKCMYTNADSLLNKRDELNLCIAQNNPDIIGVTEAFPKKVINPVQLPEFHMDGYELFCNIDAGNRGVCLYINEQLGAVPKNFEELAQPESIWCEIKLEKQDKLLVGCVYRSPNSSVDGNKNTLDLLKMASSLNYSHMLIMGDFNHPEITWMPIQMPSEPLHPATQFVECIRDCFLHQHVNKPTHFRGDQRANTLDLLITNEENMIDSLSYEAPLGKSHHVCLNFKYRCYCTVKNNLKQRFILDKGDYSGMKSCLSEINWTGVLGELSVTDAWHTFETLLMDCCKQFIPMTSGKPRTSPPRPPWINDETLSKIKEKKDAFSSQLSSRTEENRNFYARKRNQVRWISRKSRRAYEQKIASEAKSNPKGFYRYARSKMKVRVSVADLETTDGRMARTDEEKAETLNSFFGSVFTREDTSRLPSFEDRPYDEALEDVAFSEEDVFKKLSKLKISKAAGPDGIYPRILNELSTELAAPLHIIFRKSVDLGNVPQAWKDGHVSPIFKKGSRSCTGNYRPVSLTAVACKLLESLIRDAVMDHLVANNLLSDCQHGFVSGRSCSTQLLACLDIWTQVLEDSQNLDAIYLDFQKAFDTVPHQRLLKKLSGYGIRGKVLEWIKAFLANRRQRVLVNGSASQWCPVLSGIPQGSVLGPMLFVAFINDLPECVHSMVQMFADDTKLFRIIKNISDSTELQEDLTNLQEWSDKWQLRFNAAKCKVMHIGRQNEKQQYKMGDKDQEVVLTETVVEKDLGVNVDNTLTFSDHIQQAATKANNILGMIRRSYSYIDMQVLRQLYTSLVRPILEYGNVVWFPLYKKDALSIEKVQRRATKMVPGLEDLPYELRLEKMKLPSLYYRRARGDMIEVYKYLTGIYQTKSPLARDYGQRTRGHPLKLKKRYARLSVRQNYFSFRVVDLWNSLPEDVVTAPTVNSRVLARISKLPVQKHKNNELTTFRLVKEVYWLISST